MKELWDFRLKDNCVELLGLAAKLEEPNSTKKNKPLDEKLITQKLTVSDPLFRRLESLDKNLRVGTNLGAYWSCSVTRQYTNKELASAKLFHTVSPTEIYLDTNAPNWSAQFDFSRACALCGGGVKRVQPIKINVNTIPKKYDFARIQTNELIISKRLAALFTEAKCSGFALAEVINTGRNNTHRKEWFQLVVTSPKLTLAASNIAGRGPFQHLIEADPARCTIRDANHSVGAMQISEVCVESQSWTGADFNITQELIGGQLGQLIRPHPIMVVTPRVRQIMIDHQIRKASFDIARLVD